MSLRARRIILRILVLVQLAALVLVATTIRDLLRGSAPVLPGAVFLVTAMLAATAVALRATFRRSANVRGHRFAFMAAEIAVLLLPLAARGSLGIVARNEGIVGAGLIPGMLGLELLAASCIAAVSALLAPVLLAPPPESTPDAPYEASLGVWMAAAVVFTLVVGGFYKSRFEVFQSPSNQIGILFAGDNPEMQHEAAMNLIASRNDWTPEIRDGLFREAEFGKVDEKVWASYVLIASRRDDGRAMKALRSLVGGFATLRAVEALAMLGAASGPALPELAELVRQETRDNLDAAIQQRAVQALTAIGPPAIETVSSLFERAKENAHPNLVVSAATAIDTIDPAFAKRCVGQPTVLDVLAAGGELRLTPECEKRGQAPN